MKKAKKRGISPLIATILLVGFVIAVVLLVVLWGRNYIEELAAKRGALAQKQLECQAVEMTVKSVTPGGNSVVMTIENRQSNPIDEFIFRGIGEDGNSLEVVASYKKLGGQQIDQYSADFTTGGVRKVDVIPGLKAGRNKYVPCTDKHVTVKI